MARNIFGVVALATAAKQHSNLPSARRSGVARAYEHTFADDVDPGWGTLCILYGRIAFLVVRSSSHEGMALHISASAVLAGQYYYGAGNKRCRRAFATTLRR